MQVIDYINNRKVNNPINNDDVALEINFQPGDNDVSLSTFSFEWAENEAKILTDYLKDGVSGGKGITMGLPHRREIVENGKILSVLDGYIDLASAQWDRDLITADTKERAGLEWVTEVADGIDFQTLYQKGFLTDNDKVFVPYVISSVPNYKDIMITTLTLVSIGIWIRQSIKEISAGITETTTIVDSLGGIIQTIAAIIYAIFLVISIVKLILDLVALVISRVKYAASMSVNKQIEAACSYLGLKYSSKLLQSAEWNKLHIIPEAFAPPVTQADDRIKGYLFGNKIEQTGYYTGTFGDLLRRITGMFNLRIVSSSKGLELLPMIKPLTSANFTIPNYYIPQFTTNANNLVSNLQLRFETDMVDLNTIDNYKGTIMQSQLSHPSVSKAEKNIQLLKGFNQVSFGFSRAIRKEKLTQPEDALDTLLDVIGGVIGALINVGNAVIGVVNEIMEKLRNVKRVLGRIGIDIKVDFDPVPTLDDPNLGDIIDNRIGMMLLDRDQIGNAKIVLLDVNADMKKTKIAVDNNDKLNARYIFEQFHKTKSFAPGKESAQRYIYNVPKVEMNLNDVLTVMNEGNVRFKNKIMEVVSCSWNSGSRLSDFVVSERKNYTTNLVETITEPDGN
tara:strand:- start:3677 stop:5536 length:1860 start_codon:yes stop_codon:yes gene_type:complete